MQTVSQLLVVTPRKELAQLACPIQTISCLAMGAHESIIPFLKQKVWALFCK